MGKRQADKAAPERAKAKKAKKYRAILTPVPDKANVAPHCPHSVKRMQQASATAENLWQQAVAPRTPLIIPAERGGLPQSLSSKWTNQYLKSKAGAANVTVEQRSGSTDSFGKGCKISMSFGKLVQQLQQGDNSLYMTTQEAGVDSRGQPNVMASPVQELQSDFPLQPQCMGSLVPQQINLWMGAAPEGASSGLHHDFHDNLYILLRGRKRFRLYPPSEAHKMYTYGQIKLMYPNGLIVYDGQHMVCSDGSDPQEVEQWQQQQAAEAELAAAEDAVKARAKGARARLRKAENVLDCLLAQLSKPAVERHEEDCSSTGSFPVNFKDDYVDSDFAQSSSDDDCVKGALQGPNSKKQKLGAVDSLKVNGSAAEQQAVVNEEDPHSFSQVDLSKSFKDIQKQHPLFPGPEKSLECELNSGDMLYLPCGWFHEVQSFGSGKEGGHLALNYWFHPPDNLDCSIEGMQKPYRTEFWQAMWAAKSKSEAVRPVRAD